ncbi:hypothetical protein NVP1149O_66 [Vibrio phage 1.149.O._10N.286.55.A12]|nr:hypothetical protein NVP1149O_66 [Vibrio phage 1.149.O._10N.286.55.A12]CAH9016755.1 conserved hypothetical protein [Vibrio phage 120E34-1]
MNQYTYRNMVSAQKKAEMQKEKVCQLGSKEGGFGVFHTHFICLGEMGIEELKNEVANVALMLGKTPEDLIEEMPVLREVFGYENS